ncbi:hypothetical protein B7486_65985, partial [cyanobacterium TDX16]
MDQGRCESSSIRATDLHEAGHALVAAAVGRVVRQVRGEGRGWTDATRPTENSCADVCRSIAYLAAGNAAEELVLGQVEADHGKS